MAEVRNEIDIDEATNRVLGMLFDSIASAKESGADTAELTRLISLYNEVVKTANAKELRYYELEQEREVLKTKLKADDEKLKTELKSSKEEAEAKRKHESAEHALDREIAREKSQDEARLAESRLKLDTAMAESKNEHDTAMLELQEKELHQKKEEAWNQLQFEHFKLEMETSREKDIELIKAESGRKANLIKIGCAAGGIVVLGGLGIAMAIRDLNGVPATKNGTKILVDAAQKMAGWLIL